MPPYLPSRPPPNISPAGGRGSHTDRPNVRRGGGGEPPEAKNRCLILGLMERGSEGVLPQKSFHFYNYCIGNDTIRVRAPYYELQHLTRAASWLPMSRFMRASTMCGCLQTWHPVRNSRLARMGGVRASECQWQSTSGVRRAMCQSLCLPSLLSQVGRGTLIGHRPWLGEARAWLVLGRSTTFKRRCALSRSGSRQWSCPSSSTSTMLAGSQGQSTAGEACRCCTVDRRPKEAWVI